MELHHKFPLEATAAMALILGEKAYSHNKHIAKYMEELDLSSGADLAEKLKKSSPFAEDIVVNRKYYYHKFVLNHIESNKHNSQVIILGAGYDPISVHILETHANQVNSILEIDSFGFDNKKTIFKDINVPNLEKIQFIKDNVVTTRPIDIVRQYGYDDHKPVVIMLEALSCFLSEEYFKEIISSFKSPNHSNSFCLDFIFPYEEITNEEIRLEHRLGCEAVAKQANIMNLSLYSASHLVEFVKNLGGINIVVTNQREVELKRLGHNKAFKNDKEGIFEFLSFNI